MEDIYEGGIGVYSEAKGEYTKQLIQFLTPALSRFFMKLLQQAQTDTAGSRGLLAKFQELMSVVPEWNIDKVQRETTTILGETKCDYLEELLSAVFIAHTKVLTAIRPNSWKNKKVQIIVPKMDHFIHRAMSESCRLLWKSAYLFQQDIAAVEKQKNYRGIEFQIGEGVSNAIRALLPVKNILKDCLSKDNGADDSDSDSDSDNEDIPVKALEQVPVQVPVQAPVQEQEVKTLDDVHITDGIKVEKLEEVTITNIEEVSTSTAEEENRLFTHKQVKELNVEKLEAEESPVTPVSPSVKFNDYDQVYTPIVGGGGNTTLAYVPKTEDGVDDENYSIDIIGDSSSVLSGIEDLDFSTDLPALTMEEEDYEEL